MLNELFRTYKKIIFIVLIMGSAVIFWFFGCYRQENKNTDTVTWEKKSIDSGGYRYIFSIDDLTGDMVFGLKGYTVKDENIPVVVHLTPSSADFSGLVRITVPGSSGSGISYQSAIQCVRDEQSELILSIPQLGNASYFCFEILDQYGNILLSKMEIPQYSEWLNTETEVISQICLGVLSDQFDSLSFMDGMRVDTDMEEVRIRLVNLDEDCFPVLPDAGNILSGILIDDYSVETLKEEQRSALLSWIKRGGRLVIATGEYGKKSLSGLNREMKVYDGEVDTDRLYFNSDGDFSGELSLYINRLTFDNNAGWKTVNWSDPDTLYERSYGEGRIYTLRFSFTDESILQWNRLGDMTRSLMKQVFDSIPKGNADKENLIWNMEIALHDFDNSQMPNAFYYGIFFLVYLGMLILIAYYMLSRIKKREYIWGVVPVIALMFTLGIVSRSVRTSTQEQSSLSAIRVVDEKSAENDIYFLYQNAEGESLNVNLISSVDRVIPIDYDYAQEVTDYNQIGSIQEEYTISDTIKGYDISFSEAPPGTARLLQMTENKSMNYGEKTKVFSSEIKGNHTAFSGVITNTSEKDFDKIILIRGNQYWKARDMKAGSYVYVEEKDVRAWDQSDEDNVLSQDGEDMVMQDILSYVLYRYIKDNSDLGSLIAVGISLNDNYQLLRTRDATLGNQVSVYVNHLAIAKPEAMDCQVDINREYLKEPAAYDDLLSQLPESTVVEADYQFDPGKLVWVMARGRDDYQGRIYAYNYITQEKDQIMKRAGDVMYCEDLEPYLSDMNVMKIIYELPDDTERYELPILSVWLKKGAR